MTKTVADQIIQVVNDLCQKFGIVMDWSKETIMPMVEHLGSRIIDWRIAECWFWIILCGILFIAGIVAIICAIKFDCEVDLAIVLSTLGAFAVIGFGVGTAYNIYDLIKVLTFPELAILEYVKTFMQ